MTSIQEPLVVVLGDPGRDSRLLRDPAYYNGGPLTRKMMGVRCKNALLLQFRSFSKLLRCKFHQLQQQQQRQSWKVANFHARDRRIAFFLNPDATVSLLPTDAFYYGSSAPLVAVCSSICQKVKRVFDKQIPVATCSSFGHTLGALARAEHLGPAGRSN